MQLKLDGNINEDKEFPDLESEDRELEIDFAEVRSINSMGIRNWIKWSKAFENFDKVSIYNLPRVIVEQINMIHQFLPQNAIVMSFYVPFYSEETDEERVVLLKRGVDFDEDDVRLPKVVDSQNNEMEPDVFADRYFAFLKK